MSTARPKKSSALARPPPARRPGREGGVRAENRKRRTEELCRSACELFLQRGLEEVTIDEIVVAAGVAKGSFYRYFDDKAALVDALFAPVVARVRAAFGRCSDALPNAKGAEALTLAYMSLALELGETLLATPDIARLYLQECRAPGVGARKAVAALADEVRSSAIVLTEAAQRYGVQRRLDPQVSALAVVGAAEHLFFAYLTGSLTGTPEALAADLISLVLEGISVPASSSS